MVEADYTGVLLDGRYRVEARRGQGGMGTVYVAEHVGLGQPRAIKFLRADLARKPGAIQRFLQEARVLSAMRHDNLVGVIDMGEHAGSAYYVMELLAGEDLRQRLRRLGGLGWPETRAIALQVCAALRTTHARGVVHRDLKPENCFCVAAADAGVHVKLIDFGVAKVPREAGGASQLTGAGELLGTIGYMAPEQLEGQGDRRADIYSLGAMMFEMLAGRPLHTGNAYEILAHMLLAPAPALASVIAVDPAIDRLLATAVARDPDQRFASMDAFAAAIAEIPVTAAPQTFDRPASAPAGPAGETTAGGTPVPGDMFLESGPADRPPARPHPRGRADESGHDAPTPANTRVPGLPSAMETRVPGLPSAMETRVPGLPSAMETRVPGLPSVMETRVPAAPSAMDTRVPGAPVLTDSPAAPRSVPAVASDAPVLADSSAAPGSPVLADSSAAPTRARVALGLAALLAVVIAWRIWPVDEAPAPAPTPSTVAIGPDSSASPRAEGAGPAASLDASSIGPVPGASPDTSPAAPVPAGSPDTSSIGPVPAASPGATPTGPVPGASPAVAPSGPVPAARPGATPTGPVPAASPAVAPSGPVPGASPAAASLRPAARPRDAARPIPAVRPLTREALRDRLERELAACGSPYVAEEIAVRVTPGKAGTRPGLAAIADERLAPGTVACVERELARALAGLTEGVDAALAFDVSLRLPRRGGG